MQNDDQQQEQGLLFLLGLALREVLEMAEILDPFSLYQNKSLKVNGGRYMASSLPVLP